MEVGRILVVDDDDAIAGDCELFDMRRLTHYGLAREGEAALLGGRSRDSLGPGPGRRPDLRDRAAA